METAKAVLGNGRLLNDFVSRLLDDISNLKAMLRAISIGAQAAPAAADGHSRCAAADRPVHGASRSPLSGLAFVVQGQTTCVPGATRAGSYCCKGPRGASQ